MSLTAHQLAGNQRRTLRAMRERLLKMAAEWDDVDGFIETELVELADKVEAVRAALEPDDRAAP
jgi:hypothetical protein